MEFWWSQKRRTCNFTNNTMVIMWAEKENDDGADEEAVQEMKFW